MFEQNKMITYSPNPCSLRHKLGIANAEEKVVVIAFGPAEIALLILRQDRVPSA